VEKTTVEAAAQCKFPPLALVDEVRGRSRSIVHRSIVAIRRTREHPEIALPDICINSMNAKNLKWMIARCVNYVEKTDLETRVGD